MLLKGIWAAFLGLATIVLAGLSGGALATGANDLVIPALVAALLALTCFGLAFEAWLNHPPNRGLRETGTLL